MVRYGAILAVLLSASLSAVAGPPTPFKDGGTLTVKADDFADLAATVPDGAGVTMHYSPRPAFVASAMPEGRTIFRSPGGSVIVVEISTYAYDAEKKKVIAAQQTMTVVFLGAPVVPPVIPPGPLPIPPGPVSPESKLLADLQAAYTAEPATTKPTDLANLTAAMRKAAEYSKDTAYPTKDALTKAVGAYTVATVGRGRLTRLGEIIGAYMVAQLGDDDAVLNQDSRAGHLNAYNNVTAALAQLK